MSGAGVDSRECRRGGLFGQLYLLLSLTSLFWAGNTVLGRFVAGHVPPITLACIHWAGAFLSAAVCVAASGARLAGDPQACRIDDAVGADRLLRLQHDGPLRLAVHDRHQRSVVAIDRAAVRRVRRPPDGAPGRRHVPFAQRRPRHRQSR
jgi:hypothetical protein